jgi:hypothetical protein
LVFPKEGEDKMKVYCPWKIFMGHFEESCKELGYRKPKWTRNLYEKPFKKRGIVYDENNEESKVWPRHQKGSAFLHRRQGFIYGVDIAKSLSKEDQAPSFDPRDDAGLDEMMDQIEKDRKTEIKAEKTQVIEKYFKPVELHSPYDNKDHEAALRIFREAQTTILRKQRFFPVYDNEAIEWKELEDAGDEKALKERATSILKVDLVQMKTVLKAQVKSGYKMISRPLFIRFKEMIQARIKYLRAAGIPLPLDRESTFEWFIDIEKELYGPK